MIFYRGDIHGDARRVTLFSKIVELTEKDTFILLGDVGANYYLNSIDEEMKDMLATARPTILCIHGNHECRPEHIPTYIQKEWCGGVVWYEEKYPNILFAKDGEIYTIEGIRHLVIGGAYSVDKHMRLTAGHKWWEDEQPSEETKRRVEQVAAEKEIDIILSHTCPARYKPTEAFLPMIDQDTVDDSTEQWLDTLVEKISHKKWLCGHWHIDKHIDKMIFMFKDYLSIDEVLRERLNRE